jgi:PAS domain S-box-containing protein
MEMRSLKTRILWPRSAALLALLCSPAVGAAWTAGERAHDALVSTIGSVPSPADVDVAGRATNSDRQGAGTHGLIAVTAIVCLATGALLFAFFHCILCRAQRRRSSSLADRLRSQEAMRSNLQLLETLINTIPNPVFYKDLQGRYLDCNETFAREIIGLPRQQIIGRSLHELPATLPPEIMDDHREQDPKLLSNPGAQFYETAVRCPDGVSRDFFFSKATVRDAAGKPTGIVGVMVDISARKKAEERLKRSHGKLSEALRREKSVSMTLEATMEQLKAITEEAEAATRAKSEFLANMSHEIRTPMTAILGFAENLLDPGLPENERVSAACTIHDNGEHLLQIINDILDISKIEAGKIRFEQVRCSLVQLVQETLALMRVRSDAKGLSLTAEYDGPVPETIRSDPTRLKQILINLLGNAIKFTEVGGVRMVTRLVKDATDQVFLQFDVIDTGLGMSTQQIAMLFQPFSQADGSTSRRHGGTGLGLTISKRLAEMLGGGIAVESEPNHGSTFRVTVAAGPIDGAPMIEPDQAQGIIPRPQAPKPPSSANPSLQARILLAEDGPDNQKLVSFMLKKAGAEVTLADNGQEAVRLATEAAARNEPFDVILMDMQMPVMDGYQATALLRSQGYSGAIIALTAHAMAGDRDTCLAAGCDEYATKPVERTRLIELIQQHLNPASCGA